MSQVTTHILDTSLGKPAQGVQVQLQQQSGANAWETMAEGATNADGRIGDLLSKDKVLPQGVYRMVFDTGAYFKFQMREHFYPVVEIVFEITDASHYHVPLLLNPYGYSTYRGS